MNIIETYEKIDSIRCFMVCYNLAVERDHRGIPLEYVQSSLEWLIYHNMQNKFFESSRNECDYWRTYLDQAWQADRAKDYLYIYDFLGELKGFICKLLNTLWQNYADELSNYILQQNIAALSNRYLEISRRIEQLNVVNDLYGVREYGLRGKVVYLKQNEWEHDLYSEFNPGDFAMQVLKKYSLEKYRKIYMWLLGCDLDINAVWLWCEEYQITIEVYISRLEALNAVLHKTMRAAVLANERIHYHFECSIEEFLKDIDLAEESFMYAGAYSLDTKEREKLEQYISRNSIHYSICELT